MDTIFEATKRRCIGHQNEVANSHYNASWYRDRDYLERATVHQRDAAAHHFEMWMRLERLLGIA